MQNYSLDVCKDSTALPRRTTGDDVANGLLMEVECLAFVAARQFLTGLRTTDFRIQGEINA